MGVWSRWGGDILGQGKVKEGGVVACLWKTPGWENGRTGAVKLAKSRASMLNFAAQHGSFDCMATEGLLQNLRASVEG